jgi:hypothetical protein
MSLISSLKIGYYCCQVDDHGPGVIQIGSWKGLDGLTVQNWSTLAVAQSVLM